MNRIRLLNNHLLNGPEEFDFEILSGIINPIPEPIKPIDPIIPSIDLTDVYIHNSPTDMANWNVTRFIKRIEMSRNKGFSFTFDQQLPDSWKWASNPLDPSDNYQCTVWPIITYRGVKNTSGIVQLWQGRGGTGGFQLPTWHDDFHKNWCYDSRWGDMSLYFPNPGDVMGFFVSAGNARGQAGITSVKERSNVVTIVLPPNDVGSWDF